MRWRPWSGCLRGQRGAPSTPRRWPRLFHTDTARRSAAAALNFCVAISSDPRAARPARASPVKNRPTAHEARARLRTWRGCLRGQRGARSTPRHWPRRFFTDTEPGRRLWLRDLVTRAFESRAVRPARASPHGELANHRGARARWRTWRGCLSSQRATRSTPRRWPRLFCTDIALGRWQ